MLNIDTMEEYIRDNDVHFIRLAFFDVFGEQRNIAIMPQEMRRAVEEGITFDSAAIPGFFYHRSDLFLEPELNTVTIIPWRSIDGGVVRILCRITYPDGTPFQLDSRFILKQAVKINPVCIGI